MIPRIYDDSDNEAEVEAPADNPVFPWKHIARRLAHLVNSELYADFYFIITDDDNRRVPAHKLLVAAGSEELCKIVHGTSALPGVSGNSTQVDEITADGFVEILRYLYTDEVNFVPYMEYIVDCCEIVQITGYRKCDNQLHKLYSSNKLFLSNTDKSHRRQCF